MVVRCGAAFHLAELCEDVLERRAVGEVGGGSCRTRRTIGRRRLDVLIPAQPRPLLLVAAVELVVPGLVPGLRGLAGRGYEAVVEDYAATRGSSCSMHRGEDGDGVGVAEVGAYLVLEAVLDDGGVRAEGFDHLDAFDEHVALREFVGCVGRGLHGDGVGDGLAAGLGGAGGGLADGHLAGAGLHVAEQAVRVVGSEDLFLGEVAVEVEAVEAELLRLVYFLYG